MNITDTELNHNKLQTFTWNPVSQFPENLEKPVICLTQYGHIITFNCMGNPKELINGKPHRYYNRFYGCIYWAYAEELTPLDIEYKNKKK